MFLKKYLFIIFILFLPFITKANFDLPTLPIKNNSIKRESHFIQGEVIVKYKNTDKKTQFLENIKKDKSDIEVKKEIAKKNVTLLKSNKKSTQELITELKKDPHIELVEPNYKRENFFIPNDSYFSGQWSLRNTGQSVNDTAGTNDADIDVDEMWDIESSLSSETIVAVIDDGVDYTNPDLINNMWDGTTCVDELGLNIAGGCPNHGWDYQNNDNDPYGNKHGTLVSSLIASQVNNSDGIAGLSRYDKIKIMAIQFNFDLFTELMAIDFAANNGAKVINASYGGYDYSQMEKDFIDEFDGIFIAAAGNGGDDHIGDNNDILPEYPCSYTSTNIICVASSDQNDELSDFSNYGASSVDIMAPGENMIGLYLGEYYISDGTSLSTPLVAGTAALLYSQNPTANITTIRDTLLKSSDHMANYSSTLSCGRKLNMKTSLQSIINNEIPTETCSNLNATLFFDQSSISTTVRQTFNIKAKINPGTNEVGGAELDINFDPTVLKLNSITKSSFFNATLFGPIINNTSGLGSIDVGLLTDPITYITEISDIVNFNFTTLTPTDNSTIYFSATSNASAHGEYVVSNRENCLLEIKTNTPIYRIYNTKTGVHVYARGQSDRDLTMNTWPEFEFTDGLPAFYASLSEGVDLTPIYRVYNTKTGAHVYTRGETERQLTLDTWPEFEFTDGLPAFYASLNN